MFTKKIITPDMTHWHQDPANQLKLEDLGEHVPNRLYPVEKPLLIFVGGAMDDIYRPLLHGVFVPYRLQNSEQQDIIYATHGAHAGLIEIIHKWHDEGQKVALIGHSWGGQTVLDIARKLQQIHGSERKIDLLVTLDPVSRRFLAKRQEKPANVSRWINIYVDYNRASLERSNLIARIGGYWGHCNHADRNIKMHRKQGQEVTHAKVNLMFAEVLDDVRQI